MANQFVNLPAPASGNGAGAAVDVSAFGASKTVVVAGSWPTTQAPIVTIEINNDPAQDGTWSPVNSGQGGRISTFDVAARWMRQRVANYRSGSLPNVDVGGTDDGTDFAALPVPDGNGSGAAVDVSALGLFKTFQVGGAFRGSVIVEVSTDGATNWAQVTAFTAPGATSMIVAAHWMRIRRQGVPVIAPGQPIVNLGGVQLTGGGLTSVLHDDTLTGDGASTPLSVVAVDGPTRRLLTNATGVLVPAGTPVYINGDGTFALANAGAVGTSRVVGLAQADIAIGANGFVVTHGPLELTTAQWDAVAGTAGGLVFDTPYYLAATNGQLTAVAPSAGGQSVTLCLVAVGTTTAIVSIQPPILL